MTADRTPSVDRPASFARYLRVAAGRGRRSTGTGLRYEVFVALLWFGPGVAIGAWRDLDTSTTSTSPLNWAAAGLLLLAGTAVLGMVCVTIGPVTASREWRAWVLSTPLDRRALLRRRTAGLLTLLIVPGVVLGAVVADAAGFRHGRALAAVVLGGAAAVVAGGLAMWQQRIRPAGAARGRGWLWCAAGLAAAALVANLQDVGRLDAAILPTAALIGCPVAVAVAVLGVSGVGLIPLSSLAAGSGSLSSLALAVQDQSLAPLAAVLATSPGRRPTRAPLRPLTGIGRRVLINVDRRRTLRNRPAITRWLAMALIPYAAWGLFGGIGWSASALAAVTFTAGVAATSGLCSTARQFAGTPALADRYGLSRAECKNAAMVLPEWGALLWALATAPALLLHAPQRMVLIVPATALAVVEFRARQGPFVPQFGLGGKYSADMGRLFARGPALLLGGAVAMALITAGLQQRHL